MSACDHEHSHEHEHAADCTCGCHEHEHAAPEGEFVSVELHEGAAVASYRFELPHGADVREHLTRFATAVGSAVDELGCLIGHIKVMAQCGSQVVKVSVTDETPEVDEFCVSSEIEDLSAAEGVAIVIGIECDELERIVRGAIGE